MVAPLKKVFHAIKLCIAKMTRKCYASNLIQDVERFVATLFMSIVMNDAKEMLE